LPFALYPHFVVYALKGNMIKKKDNSDELKTARDKEYMRRALSLARRGIGRVSPNPAVGSVIVRGSQVIGEGYHREYGGAHAEIAALESASGPVRGAEIYVTLEPCTHFGKTPPCVNRIIRAGPARVIIGTEDPNPLVSGKGIRALRGKGIETSVGVLEKECRELNEFFFKYIRTGIPYVTLKFAQSLDGRIAARGGDSRWISSPESRKIAHAERRRHDAVMVGSGTVMRDDPELTVRLVRGKSPLRIVLDSSLQISPAAKVLQMQDAKTIIVTADRAGGGEKSRLERMGIEVISVDPDLEGRPDLRKVLVRLGERNISSVLVEGGAELLTSFLKTDLPDRIVAFIAPKIIGQGIETFGDLGIAKIEDSIPLKFRKITKSGGDVLVEGIFVK